MVSTYKLNCKPFLFSLKIGRSGFGFNSVVLLWTFMHGPNRYDQIVCTGTVVWAYMVWAGSKGLCMVVVGLVVGTLGRIEFVGMDRWGGVGKNFLFWGGMVMVDPHTISLKFF